MAGLFASKFHQVTFTLLGFACMVLLEVLEVSSTSTAMPETAMLGKEEPQAKICRLESIDELDLGSLPLNFTCDQGLLELL